MGLGLPEAFASNVWTTTRPTDGPYDGSPGGPEQARWYHSLRGRPDRGSPGSESKNSDPPYGFR